MRSSRSCSAEQTPLSDRAEPRIRGDGSAAVTQGQALAGRALPDPGRHAAARTVRPRRPAAPMAAQHLHRPVPRRPPGLRGARMEEAGGHPPVRPLRRPETPRLGQRSATVRSVDWIEAKQMGLSVEAACLGIRFSVGCALIIPMIIQTILLYPSGAVWTDEASNVSRLDPSGAVQIDAEHPSRNRKVEGSNPSSGSKTAGQRVFLTSPTTQRQPAVIPLTGCGAEGAPAPLRYVGVRPIDSSPVDGPPSSAHSGRNHGGRTIGPALWAGSAFARIQKTNLRLRRHSRISLRWSLSFAGNWMDRTALADLGSPVAAAISWL